MIHKARSTHNLIHKINNMIFLFCNRIDKIICKYEKQNIITKTSKNNLSISYTTGEFEWFNCLVA